MNTRQAHAEDARVLPAGRFRVSMIYAQTGQVTQNFNSRSNSESLTAPYNFDLSSANIAKLKPEIQDLVNFLNNTGWRYNVQARGDGSHGLTHEQNYPALGDALSRGFLAVDAQAMRQQYNLAFQYGVTDRLSVGFFVPYVHTAVNVSHSLSGVNTAKDIQDSLVSPNGGSNVSDKVPSALSEISNVNEDQLQNVLVSKGYSRFGSSDVSGLGDVILGARYMYFQAHAAGGDWIHSVQAGVTVPTGHLKPPSELTQVDFGSGSWDLGLAHISNYSPTDLITFSAGLHYTYRFWGHRTIWVKENPSDLMADSSGEENVAQRLGDKYWGSIGTTFNLSRAFTIDTSYEWLWKNLDQFRGARAGRDYSYLSDDSDMHTETFQMGASFSSIPAFMKHDLPLPAQLSANLYLPLRGKNTPIAPYGTAELALYF